MAMRWEDERYVRLYTRDSNDWLDWSLEAQGLFALILRKVDRAGVLELGRHGKRGVALAIGHRGRWEVISPALEELLADGCVEIRGDTLVVRNFIEAQEAKQSDAARQRAHRERARDIARHGLSQNVTGRDTEGGAASRQVTPSLPSHAEPSVPSQDQEQGDSPLSKKPDPPSVIDPPAGEQGGKTLLCQPTNQPPPAQPRSETRRPAGPSDYVRPAEPCGVQWCDGLYHFAEDPTANRHARWKACPRRQKP